MGKIIIYIYDRMADFEVTFAAQLLNGIPGKQVLTVADEIKVLQGTSGLYYQPEVTFSEINIDEIDALIIPGGYGKTYSSQLIALIQNLDKKKKLIAAICAAPRFLAKAGILNERNYTTSLTEWNDNVMKDFGEEDPFPRENFQQERVVVDDNIITSQGFAFVDFAIEILDWFKLFQTNEEKSEFQKQVRGI